jgi:hypothetical protein
VILGDENILKDIFSEDAPKRTIFALYGVIVLLMSYHALVYFVLDSEKIMSRNDVQEYTVEFLENASVTSESRVVLDDEPETLEFTVDENLYNSFNGFGYLEVTVSYAETGGIVGGPCDSVSVDIPPNGASADWQHPSNILAGTSDDCSDINLYILVYPEYNNFTQIVAGGSSDNIVSQWTNNEHGSGTFTININVDSTSSAPPPAPQDNDEEVSVTWSAYFFNVNVKEA